MPIVNILGFDVYIPDLTDLANFVVSPLANFINNVRDYIVTAFNASISFLTNLPTVVINALSSFSSSVISAVSSGFSTIASIVISSVTTAVNTASTFIINNIVNPLSSFFSSVTAGLTSFVGSVFASIQSTLTAVYSLLPTIISAVGNLPASLQTSLSPFLTSVSNGISKTGEFIVNGFNQLSTSINAEFLGIGIALQNLGAFIWQAFDQAIIEPAKRSIEQGIDVIRNLISRYDDTVKNFLLTHLPRSPDQAIDFAINAATTGALMTIEGQTLAILAEAIYPTKHLGIPEAVSKALELTGIATITSALYGIIVSSGFGTQLKYYFNYNLQPLRLGSRNAKEDIYYQTGSIEQFTTELRYEGYNDEAIKSQLDTLYAPLPPRMIIKLLDSEVFDDDFFIRELRKSGLDPETIPNMIKAFKLLPLKAYASNAKSLVYQMFRDGFLDESQANAILLTFGTDQQQIAWILTLANYDYQYDIKRQLRDTYLALLAKGVESPQDAISDLQSLGMNPDKAKVLVTLTAVKSAPTPNKALKAQILEEATGIKIEVEVKK